MRKSLPARHVPGTVIKVTIRRQQDVGNIDYNGLECKKQLAGGKKFPRFEKVEIL